jgi:D-cysteine desulfhydrase family pyridoxal phosphate-dependent enzyme
MHIIMSVKVVLAKMKKCSFSFTPTPVHKLDKISKIYNINCWIKRDDLTGCIATGGNKIRKLEYILADALDKGADTVITAGGPQSNHAKATAALAIKVGLQPVLVLAGTDPGKREANLWINQLLGADIRFSGAITPSQIEEALHSVYVEMEKEGKIPYLIPIGGSNGLGSLGYIDAYNELAAQERDFDWIILTAGSGGTFAGIYLANQMAGNLTKIVGFSPWLKEVEIRQRVIQCIQEIEPDWKIEELLLNDQYIGRGYGKRTDKSDAAIKLLASEEAILLDHVYTGKAMAGLLDYIDKGIIKPQEKVLFWHTGGAPGLFAIQQEWL